MSLEQARDDWEALHNQRAKDRAIAYASALRKEFPEIKHPHSKAKIPYNQSGDQILTDNAKRYIKTVTYESNKIWHDAFEIVGFKSRYQAETVVKMKSLITGTRYYMGISDVGELWDKMCGKILVGRWMFEKNGKTTKIKLVEDE